MPSTSVAWWVRMQTVVAVTVSERATPVVPIGPASAHSASRTRSIWSETMAVKGDA